MPAILRFVWGALSCLAIVLVAVHRIAAEETPPIGFDALLGFDKLPLLVDWPAFQDSSYHRDDINQDAGNFLRVEPNGDQVLTDVEGPGVVYRLWSTGVVGRQMSDDCRLRFYFDGEEKPRLDLSMPEIFGDRGSRWPFVPPLSETFESGRGDGEGPCNLCYVPIPFAKGLKIVGRNVMFYHVDYHKLPPGTAVESFSYELAEKHRKTIEQGAAVLKGIPRRPGTSPEEKFETLTGVTLKPGETRRIRIDGEGVIGTVAVKLAEPTPEVLRGVVLQAAFDSEDNVCVRVPIGDFFGSGCGDRRFQSLPTGMAEQGYYSYWPMPFREAAVVSLRNDTARPVTIDHCRVGYVRRSQPANAGYFHARYVENHDIPLHEDYRILDVQGRGKLVGTNVTMQNARGAQGIFFLEGDEKIYVDGESYPSRWLGTGAEDYFNGSYFWNAPNKAAMARPHGGLTFLDWGIGRVCAYRWHILDFVSFQKDIRLDLEHGGVSEVPCDYQSVAYYYLDKPTAQPPLPALAARLPKTALPPAPGHLCCSLAAPPELDGKRLVERAIVDLGPGYSSVDTVLFGQGRPGQRIEVPLDVPGLDEYTLELFVTGGPEYGPLNVSLDGKSLGKVDATKLAFTPWFATDLGKLRLDGGRHELILTLAERETSAKASHDDTASGQLSIGLVAVQLRPHSRRIDQWSVVGNWPSPQEGGWEKSNPPEKSQDLTAVYPLPNGREARWRKSQGDFVGLAGGGWVAAYGLTYIHSPDDRSIAMFITKDDGLKLWVNDEVAFDKNAWSHPMPDQFHCTVKLKQGWNTVLVKSVNHLGGWGFALRPGDPDRDLKFARKPE